MKLVLSNPGVFEDFERSKSFNKDYLSEFNINNQNENIWKNLFIDKKFNEIKDFLEILPVNNTDEIIQDLIYDILVSKKLLDRDLVGSEEDQILFKLIVEKLFQTGRLSEIELIYSQTTDFENNTFILKKMIEGNLLRNRHSEACKILEKVNQDPIFFGKIMIICNIINGRYDQAKLGLQLLKEQNQPGDIFSLI